MRDMYQSINEVVTDKGDLNIFELNILNDINERYSPHDIFTYERLKAWALENGFYEEQQ